jgi:hypothetical protein
MYIVHTLHKYTMYMYIVHTLHKYTCTCTLYIHYTNIHVHCTYIAQIYMYMYIHHMYIPCQMYSTLGRRV